MIPLKTVIKSAVQTTTGCAGGGLKKLSSLKNSEPADIFLALNRQCIDYDHRRGGSFLEIRKSYRATLIRNNKIMQEDYLPSGISLNLQRNR